MKKQIILQPEIKYTATGYTKPIITDNPIERTITAKVNLIADDEQQYDYPPLVLWTGDEYEKAGQWTDEDAVKRLEELLNQ